MKKSKWIPDPETHECKSVCYHCGQCMVCHKPDPPGDLPALDIMEGSPLFCGSCFYKMIAGQTRTTA